MLVSSTFLNRTNVTTVPPPVLHQLRLVCLDLPEAAEQQAWVGIRWVVAKKNFAHVLMIEAGYPPAYAKAAGSAGPLCVLTVRGPRPAIDAPRFRRAPFFRPPWFDNIVGLSIDASTDWEEVQDLLVQSYCLLAPMRLSERMDRRRD
ncbi:hypothetical protein [Hydrogenophaga sp. SL48]|uniref:hypothetical protein n=1 Tax=Hydrogenophaga sp. SL48 TaxID=2806347 RepID=UPI001F3854D7|nr:hypothetical protein [Hydrogenophaga sp. SL48]UJW79210.1 MmcQ/YjbR family DNA-binding protein [Hydrogenophaga sp. SL48]